MMADGEVGLVLREAMLVVLKLSGPPLAVALAVGFVMSLVQAVTQINEPTLTFVPKVLGIGATLMLLGGFMLATLSDFTTALMDRLIAIGGS